MLIFLFHFFNGNLTFRDYLPHCDSVLADFSERRWDILWDLATKFVSTFNQGTLPNTQTNPR